MARITPGGFSMTGSVWILLAVLAQERFSLSPDDTRSPVRLVITVPEPLARAAVFLNLESLDGTPLESEIPRLLRDGGWAIAVENNLVRLHRTDDSHAEPPAIEWRWRTRGSTNWREDQWTNLTGPVPIETRLASTKQTHWRWGWVVAEGLVVVGLMVALFCWHGSRHPAKRFRHAMKRMDPGEPAWATMRHFIDSYLADYWCLAGRKPSLAWHMRRLDSNLGRRLEQLMEATCTARHGTTEVEQDPLVEAWSCWLTDAEAYRMRRL